MTNRSILNQNTNGRNILNIRPQKLQDGKAIKISDRNKIDVNMKTNTTEQSTIGDSDLFLLSDSTGADIKYITGINLKQKVNLHLIAGNNISLTTNDDNDTLINLDDDVDTAGSITCEEFLKVRNSGTSSSIFGGVVSLEHSYNHTSYPLRFKLQVRNSTPFSSDVFDIIAEDDDNNSRLLFGLISSDYTQRHTANFNTADVVGVYKLNNYRANLLTLNNNESQYIIKDTNVNFSVNDLLGIDSNGKITPKTNTDILGSLIAGNNLTKTGNTIDLDASLTGITNINTYRANLLTLNNTNSQYVIKDVNVSFTTNDLLGIDNTGKITPKTNTDILGSLIAGNNLTKTGNTIDLDDNVDTNGTITCKNFVKINNSGSGTIGGILSLESSYSQSTYPNRFKLQTEHLNNRDKFQIIAEDNSSNQQILLQIDTGTNHTNTHSIDFNFAELTTIKKLNTYRADLLTLNNNLSQFIIKDTNVNFSTDDLLGIDSNGKITPKTNTDILGTLTVSNGLSKSTNNIQIATDAVVDTPTFKLRNFNGHCDFTIQSGATNKESRIYFLNNNLEKARIIYANANNRLDIVALTGKVELKSYISTNGGTSSLKLNDGNFELQAGSSTVSLTNIIKGDLTTVDIFKELDLNGNILTFKANDDFQYIRYLGSGMDGLEYHGYGTTTTSASHRFKCGLGGTAVLELYPEKVDINATTTISEKVSVSANSTTLGGICELLKGTTTSYDIHDWEILNDAPDANNRWLVFRALASGNLSQYDFMRIGLTDTNSTEPATQMVDVKCRLAMNNNAIRLGEPNSSISYITDANNNNGIEIVNRVSTDSEAVVSIKSGFSTNVAQFFRNRVEIYQDTDMNNKAINFKTNQNTNGIVMDSGNVYTNIKGLTQFKPDGTNNVVQLNTTSVEVYQDIDMNDKGIFFQADVPNHYIKYDGDNGNGLFYSGGGAGGGFAHRFYTTNGNGSEILSMYDLRVSFKKPIWMNTNAINFWNESDENHQIKHSFDTDPVNMNGILIKAYGNNDAFCRFQSSAGGTFTVMDLFKQKISMYKPLYMNSTPSIDRPIYLHTDQNFYIKYQYSSFQNVVEVKGYEGVHLGSTAANNVNLKVQRNFVEIGGYAGVVQDSRTNIPLSQNDTLIVRNEGLATLRVRSFANNAQLLLQASNNFNASISYSTSQLRIETVGKPFYMEVGDSTCDFVNDNGRLAWQSDRNLVVYNTGGGAVWSSNTSVSERRFKDNIVSLDLENSYNIIKQLNPVSFVYKEDPNIPKKGFIVDEVEDKIPECIKEITNCECEDMSSKLLYKEDIVPDLVASVKFLINKVESLNQQIITQSTLISNLQSQINNI